MKRYQCPRRQRDVRAGSYSNPMVVAAPGSLAADPPSRASREGGFRGALKAPRASLVLSLRARRARQRNEEKSLCVHHSKYLWPDFSLRVLWPSARSAQTRWAAPLANATALTRSSASLAETPASP